MSGNWSWGFGGGELGIGDWDQSPIPNPQSPIPNPHIVYMKIINFFNNKKNLFNFFISL